MLNPFAPSFDFSPQYPTIFTVYDEQQGYMMNHYTNNLPMFVDTPLLYRPYYTPAVQTYALPTFMQTHQNLCSCQPPSMPFNSYLAMDAHTASTISAGQQMNSTYTAHHNATTSHNLRTSSCTTGSQCRGPAIKKNNKMVIRNKNTTAIWLPRSVSADNSAENSSNGHETKVDKLNSCTQSVGINCLLSSEFEESSLGTDERTTVMIKNVPNKLSREMLIRMLDQYCAKENEKCTSDPPSEFDFIYLPMDFKSKCNLGYAFVNFTSPSGALKLYKAMHCKTWNMFSSRKIAHICYAKIQGKKALFNHFNNSCFRCDSDDYLPVILSPPRNGSSLCSRSTVVGSRPSIYV